METQDATETDGITAITMAGETNTGAETGIGTITAVAGIGIMGGTSSETIGGIAVGTTAAP